MMNECAISAIKKKAIYNLLFHCGNLSPIDRALILCDPGTRPMADAFFSVAREAKHAVELIEIPALLNHGAEPPSHATQVMQASTLILSLCQYSLAHSNARIIAGKAGANFGVNDSSPL